MMARLLLRKTLTGWVPADAEAIAATKRFELGEVYRATIVKPRSIKSLARYWVLVQMILDNTETFTSKMQLHDYLKIRAGHCTPIVAKSSGEVFLVPNSIDFDTLDEAQFAEVWRHVCNVVTTDILPGVTEVELEYEIQKLCGLGWRDESKS